jgi:hypothetical protein
MSLPFRSGGRFARLMESRLWSEAVKSHFGATVANATRFATADPTESPVPARCTRMILSTPAQEANGSKQNYSGGEKWMHYLIRWISDPWFRMPKSLRRLKTRCTIDRVAVCERRAGAECSYSPFGTIATTALRIACSSVTGWLSNCVVPSACRTPMTRK